jgi:hypothetical protein
MPNTDDRAQRRLDAEAYPHIFRAIVAATPPAGLLALRAASKTLRDTVDARLASHILLWTDGRVSSRLLPTGRLPRPLPELAEHVAIADLQAPHVDWSRYDSDGAPDATPHRCRCGWSTTRPPAHLADLVLPNLATIRRWGPHTCWAPPAPRRVTHYGGAPDAEGGAVPDEVVWYLHSPGAPSRFNRLDLGAEPRYVIGGARTGALFGMIEELKVQREVDSADEAECGSGCSSCSECGETRVTTRKVRTPATRADHFAALLAMFWLDDEDEDGAWVLVDVEEWPEWDGLRGVAAAIRERVARCCVAAHWDEAQMAGIDKKLRFLSTEEYEAEIGEVAVLEGDDHEWAF